MNITPKKIKEEAKRMGLKPLSRSVSIIGVGSTKFGAPFDTPELKDLSFQEYGAWAVLDALNDAGVNPRQVDHLVVGSTSSPTHNSMNIAPNHGLLEWVGMKGKSTNFQCSGCSTGFHIISQAVDMVAGGRCDIVVAVNIEINQSITHINKPSHIRYPMGEYSQIYGIKPFLGVNAVDTSYHRWIGSTFSAMDHCARNYMKEAGITSDELESACIGASVTDRQHGVLGPDCYVKQTFDEVAKEYGFSSVDEYMKSDMNPYFTDMIRISYTGVLCEGATAIVVCSTDIAKKFQQKPIEVVNIAQVDYSVLDADNERKMSRDAAAKIYDITGLSPEDIDYLASTNMDQTDLIDSAEAVGYLPKGESWKYFRDGKTRFDKEKPVNTDGGTQGVGHAFASTGPHHYKEAVLQMRGEAVGRQIPAPPKMTMIRGQGATHSVTITILKTLED